jgi:transposase-like protein
MSTDTPETDAMVSADQHHLEDDNLFSASVYWRMYDLARQLERERDELQKAVNGLCNHLQVSPANTTVLAVEILKIERERNEAREQRDRLAEALRKLADCDWVITLPDRMDAVRNIANEALQSLRPNER